MKVQATDLPDVVVLEPRVFADDRGSFSESWNRDAFAAEVDPSITFVQDNHSRSRRGVLRGLHYQLPPAVQGKLVRVVRGAVFDVAVDLRRSSTTFSQWVGIELTEDDPRQLWIPPGFGHGFLTLTESADVLYKTTAFYAPERDRSIRWDDPDIGIAWPLDGTQPILSEKDATAPWLADADVFD